MNTEIIPDEVHHTEPMQIFETALAAKVAARNLVHSEALKYLPDMIQALRPFLGKRCLNQGGIISEKVRKVLPQDPNTPALNWYYCGGDYSIYVRFKVCVGIRDKWNRNHCCACYAEAVCNLAEVKDQTITSLNETGPTLRTDFTEQEVLKWRQEHKAAQAALNAAQSRLADFGIYDT